MDDFDLILDNCLTQLASGASSLDECLARHPKYATRLKPLLQTAAQLERGQEIRPSSAFKVRTRAQLYAHMEAHPRRRDSALFPIWRMALSLALSAAAFLITSTAFAQAALPGQPLYGWKLASEQVWRAVSPDPVAVDLILADRRVAELEAVASDPTLNAEALKNYQETLARLESESNAQNNAGIQQALKSQQRKLSAAGISVPDLDNLLPPSDSNPPKPSTIPATVIPNIPKSLPTVVPKVIPTAHGVPSMQIPPVP